MSCGPATKNGSVMRSRASLQILVGEGSVAPGREQRICQTTRISASMMSGGRMRAATALSFGASLLAKLALGSVSRSTVPGVAGAARRAGSVVAWALSKGLFIQLSVAARKRAARATRRGSDFDALD